MGSINPATSTDVVFSGNLKFFGLGDLIQLIGSYGSTGILKITNKYSPDPGVIYFSEGNPIDARLGIKSGLDAFYSLFGLHEGFFEFQLESISIERKIHESRIQLVLSALKKIDDGEIIKTGPITISKTSEDFKVKGISLPIIKGPLVDYIYVLEEEEFEPGVDIVSEGKYGNWLWVVLKGNIKIAKETAHGRVGIVRLTTGSFIGSMASFLLGDYGRSATAIALDNVLLGVLDNNRLALEFGRLSEQMKDILLSLDRRLKNVTDLAVDYYFDKDPGSKIKSKEVYSFKGKQSDSIAIIKQGKAWAVRENNNNHVLLANLQPGDFIGHLPFAEIDHEPFSASVYRSANLSTEKIDVSLFKEEFDGLSYTFKNIIENLSACISATSLMACEFQKKRLDEQLISQ